MPAPPAAGRITPSAPAPAATIASLEVLSYVLTLSAAVEDDDGVMNPGH